MCEGCTDNIDFKKHPEYMESYIELGRILKSIHIRLVTEGWKIEPGKFTKPDGTVLYAKISTTTITEINGYCS